LLAPACANCPVSGMSQLPAPGPSVILASCASSGLSRSPLALCPFCIAVVGTAGNITIP